MSDAQTLAVYADKAKEYTDIFTKSEPSETLSRFMRALPANAAVLDLGCGPGNSAAAMRDVGFSVTATDASSAMVAMAKELYNLDVLEQSFEEISGVDVYDGIWANFSLLHAPRDAMPRHLDALRTALKSGGLLMIALKVGEGERRDRLGRFYTYYQPEELKGLLTVAGFTVDDIRLGEEPGLAGPIEPFMILFARG